jgi:hypothetical protein
MGLRLLGLEAGQIAGAQVQGHLPALPQPHIAQRVLQGHLGVGHIDQQALGRIGVSLPLAQRCAQHGLQAGLEVFCGELAHTGQRQSPSLAQALHHLLHMRGQCVRVQRAGHMLQLVVDQLVKVQTRQPKEFFVVQLAALVLQVHLQAFAKKSAHRLAQKAGELAERDDGHALRGFERRQQVDR